MRCSPTSTGRCDTPLAVGSPNALAALEEGKLDNLLASLGKEER